jgi:hypothetical protein
MVIVRGNLLTALRFETRAAATAWATKYANAGFGLTSFEVIPDPELRRLGKDAAVALAATMVDGWIPVNAALPDCDANVLVFSDEEKASVGWLDIDDRWVRTDGLDDPVTHWRPLPDCPADPGPDEVAESEELLKASAREGIAALNTGITASLAKLVKLAGESGADLETLDTIEDEMRNAERILDELLFSL